jgi:hydrogenase maturation protein HypF
MKQCLSLKIEGIVQGVGFRPFVYQLATELGLTGWVNNSSAGVSIEVEGDRPILEIFLTRLQQEKPYLAKIQQIKVYWEDFVGYNDFRITNSIGGNKTALILPDLASCPDCLQEIFDPNNRPYLYPFTNCTNCGSRFTIIETLPYDRPNTSMKHFTM